MAALLVDGPEAVALTDELDQVAASAAEAYGLDPSVELHGHEIFHAGGAWKDTPVRARVGIFDDVIEAVAARNVMVIARAMDVVGQRARYPAPDSAHAAVLQHLLERVDECVTNLGTYALVIADEVDGQASGASRKVRRVSRRPSFPLTAPGEGAGTTRYRHLRPARPAKTWNRRINPATFRDTPLVTEPTCRGIGKSALPDTGVASSHESSTHCISLQATQVAWSKPPT
jgi:hypothetical protein